jgi:hypothetical protein
VVSLLPAAARILTASRPHGKVERVGLAAGLHCGDWVILRKRFSRGYVCGGPRAAAAWGARGSPDTCQATADKRPRSCHPPSCDDGSPDRERGQTVASAAPLWRPHRRVRAAGRLSSGRVVGISLKDQVAGVTGGGRGIGRAIARPLARAEAAVAVAAKKEKDVKENARLSSGSVRSACS